MSTRTTLIFGVFDGIHDGHRSFIREAKKQGERLVAIVARDSVVSNLKNKTPFHNETERIEELLKVPEIDLVFLGDPDEGTYNIVKEVNPDIIYLGYDQQALFDNLTKVINKGILPEIKLIYGKAYEGDTLHSSILNKAHESRD